MGFEPILDKNGDIHKLLIRQLLQRLLVVPLFDAVNDGRFPFRRCPLRFVGRLLRKCPRRNYFVETCSIITSLVHSTCSYTPNAIPYDLYHATRVVLDCSALVLSMATAAVLAVFMFE